MMKSSRLAALVATLLSVLSAVCPVSAAANDPTPAEVEKALQDLGKSDPEVRVEGVRALQTSIDPRIPDAMLPLLGDEGNSVRRLAARAVGSRWWQIPKERVQTFLEALRKNEKSEFEDEVNMVHRAIGLLKGEYAGDMFARSDNKRWVIYERMGLPCLIDTTTGTEELLGWTNEHEGYLTSSWGNTALARGIHWHPAKEIAAFEMLLSRRESTVWIWRHQNALRRLNIKELLKVMKMKEIQSSAGFSLEVKGWQDDELQFEVTCATMKNDIFTDHTAVMGWNAAKDALRLISMKSEKQ